MRKRLGAWGGPKTVDRTARRRRRNLSAAPVAEPARLPSAADDTDLVVHIGLHKTASSYVQGVLAACREDLLAAGLLYPRTGIVDKSQTGTREGAGSGHGLLARRGRRLNVLLPRLLAEVDEGVGTVLISSEEFSRGGETPWPDKLPSRFGAFRSITVVLVLRRQDDWIESLYRQVVDQYGTAETRSFDEFVDQVGRPLLDFHTRFAPWRDLVGPENFHVLSYDDLPDGSAVARRLLEIAGVRGSVLDTVLETVAATEVPRYESIRPVDTVGLRILNSHRLENRQVRTGVARAIYEVAPAGEIELMSPELRERIQALCGPINQRIEDEWFAEPVPGFRFGREPRVSTASPPSGPEMVDYVGRVLALCGSASGVGPGTTTTGDGP